jgi:hypothetical protein
MGSNTLANRENYADFYLFKIVGRGVKKTMTMALNMHIIL